MGGCCFGDSVDWAEDAAPVGTFDVISVESVGPDRDTTCLDRPLQSQMLNARIKSSDEIKMERMSSFRGNGRRMKRLKCHGWDASALLLVAPGACQRRDDNRRQCRDKGCNDSRWCDCEQHYPLGGLHTRHHPPCERRRQCALPASTVAR